MSFPTGRFPLITLFLVVITVSSSYAYLNVEQYCKAFDENFKPIICILKNNANTTSGGNSYVVVERPYPVEVEPTEYPIVIPQKIFFKPKPPPKRPRPRPRPPPRRPKPRPGPPPRHPPPRPPPSRWWKPPPPSVIHVEPDYGWGWEEEDECSCDLNCYPVVANTNTTGVTYRCKSCGSSCWVRSTASSQVRCNCAVPSGNATCTCSATCATFRMSSSSGNSGWGWSDDDSESGEDANCIFTVSNLTDMRVGEEQRPYRCACCKSTEADGTSVPDFVCICQRTSASSEDEWRTSLKEFEVLDLDLESEEDDHDRGKQDLNQNDTSLIHRKREVFDLSADRNRTSRSKRKDWNGIKARKKLELERRLRRVIDDPGPRRLI